MHVYLHLFGLTIPSYGLLIASGVVIGNIIAFFVLKHEKLDFNDWMILEAYCILGGFLGAKLLYLLGSYKSIDWSRITDFQYFNALMLSGFVFYGGLIFGLIFVFLAGKIHKIPAGIYVRKFIFLIPFMHSFGRVGCFMAGCCYGIPYDGIGAVVFPEGSYAIPGIKLFPVQLVESACLMIIAFAILYLQIKKQWYYTVETYLILYAILRFCLENLRYDAERGYYAGLSTSQWISIGFLVAAMVSVVWQKKRKNQRFKNTILEEKK